MEDRRQNGGFMLPIQNYVTIMIGSKDYSVSTHFSMYDGEVFLSALKQDDDEKRAIASVVLSKINAKEHTDLTIDGMCCEDEAIYTPFIFAVINDCQELKNYYDEEDANSSPSKRFAAAYKRYHIFYEEKTDALISALVGGGRIAKMLFINERIFKLSQTFLEVFDEQLKDHTISEKKNNYEKWGRLGWTFIPSSPVTLFNSNPDNIDNPNKEAMKYCSAKDMNLLFSQLKIQRIKQIDVESAIFCYEKRQYKACALLLFGIIDSKMIKAMPKREGKFRAACKSAVDKLKNRFKPEENKHLFFYELEYTNLMTALGVFFESGEDFKKEPLTINRNFISHGMNSRRVRKRDCVQLFLVLYNLLSFFENIS